MIADHHNDYNNNEIPINDKSALLAENGAFDFVLKSLT